MSPKSKPAQSKPAQSKPAQSKLAQYKLAKSKLAKSKLAKSKPDKPASKQKLAQLGQTEKPAASPDEATLESVPNPHPGSLYLVRFTAPEFTTLCPITGQPDFAHLVLDYVPGRALVESKSFKLFLQSFRNHGAFHEDCTLMIGKRVAASIAPQWLRIAGFWYPRGGIPIDVFWQTGAPPKELWLPEPGVAPYRGRG